MKYYIITDTNTDIFTDYSGTDIREAAIDAITQYGRMAANDRKHTTITVCGWNSDDTNADPDEVISIGECHLLIEGSQTVFAVFCGDSLPDTFSTLQAARDYAEDGDTISECIAFGSKEAATAYYGESEELTESSNDDLWLSQAAMIAGTI